MLLLGPDRVGFADGVGQHHVGSEVAAFGVDLNLFYTVPGDVGFGNQLAREHLSVFDGGRSVHTCVAHILLGHARNQRVKLICELGLRIENGLVSAHAHVVGGARTRHKHYFTSGFGRFKIPARRAVNRLFDLLGCNALGFASFFDDVGCSRARSERSRQNRNSNQFYFHDQAPVKNGRLAPTGCQLPYK